MKTKSLLLGACLGSVLWAGCTTYKGTTTKTEIDHTTGDKIVTETKTAVRSFMDGKNELTKQKTAITKTTQGSSVGELNQESSGSNVVQTLRIVVEGAKTFAP